MTTLIPPNNEKKVLLHSCCAPCSGELIRSMREAGIEVTLYYYNPNVYPLKEYEKRKEESRRYCDKMDIAFVEGSYDADQWTEAVKGYEHEPERGQRCSLCFDYRFERTAAYAYENGFNVFTSSLGISRWKNLDQVNAAGLKAAEKYPGLIYWTHNWRKKGGSQRMHEIADKEHFYKQTYCGCLYSMPEEN